MDSRPAVESARRMSIGQMRASTTIIAREALVLSGLGEPLAEDILETTEKLRSLVERLSDREGR